MVALHVCRVAYDGRRVHERSAERGHGYRVEKERDNEVTRPGISTSALRHILHIFERTHKLQKRQERKHCTIKAETEEKTR